MRIQAIIETGIYVDDLQETEAFYWTIMGLVVIGQEPGRHVFFQVGEASVLMPFLVHYGNERQHLESEFPEIQIERTRP